MYHNYADLPNGKVVAMVSTPGVSEDLLREIQEWKRAGASNEDVVGCPRLRCVPSGYTPTPWN